MSTRTRIETFRHTLYQIIYQANTPAGKGFDIALMILILISVLTITLDSVADISQRYGEQLATAEWVFTTLFTVEYILRIFCIHRPIKYIISFYGLIDLLAIVPSYLGIFISDSHYLQVIRILRVLRIFRVLKLVRFINQSNLLINALMASRLKITIFMFTISTLLVIFGSAMYLIEGPEHGFANIPVSIYWAVVTLTTVGFGDITPQTDLGRAISAVVMISGYTIIAVPTGIFTAELSQEMKRQNTRVDERVCSKCRKIGHEMEANYCRICGTELPRLAGEKSG
ncbi:ion transporter [Methylobacter svalbardensis]|uniref:ion transporter n=1 Tax=Methylobacter svalbardensis TaxID=3080016 RepID=UPI0030ED8301